MSSNNGDNKLQEAVTNLLNSQIKLAERQFELDKEWHELKKEMIELRRDMDKMIDVLNKHTVLLENLPGAIKDKIGIVR